MRIAHRPSSLSTSSFLRSLPLLAACVASSIQAPALGQSGRLSPAEIEAEISFASGLAGEWGFVDLAESVVRGLEGTKLTDKTEERLGLLQCDLYSQAARIEKDEGKRRELFEQALNSYESFISNNPGSDVLGQAETQFVQTSYTLGLYIERDLGEAVGEEREALTEKLVDVLTKATERTGSLIEGLSDDPDRSNEQSTQLYTMVLRRGTMLGLIAKNTGNEYFFGEAIAALQEMEFIAGEGTPAVLHAYVALGDIYADKGDIRDASDYYEAVIEQTIPSAPGEWKANKKDRQLSSADVAVYFSFMELATKGAVRSYLDQGEVEIAMTYAMHFLNTWRKEGTSLGTGGYESLLEVARALMRAGGYVGGDLSKGEAKWYASREEMEANVRSRRLRQGAVDVALDLANQVSDERQGYLKGLAQKLIGEISERPGVTVSLDNQLEGALGLLGSEDYGTAIDKLRGVMSTLEASPETDQLEYGARTMAALGRAYYSSGRELEATLAYREALTTYRPADPDQNATNSQRFNSLAKRLDGQDDGPIADLVKESEDIVVELGSTGKYDIIFNSAGSALSAKKYEEARSKYSQIPLEEPKGEAALVKVGTTYFLEKNYDEALKVFDRYLDEILNDPTTASESRTRIREREAATGEARLRRAKIRFDQKKYPDVIRLVSDLHESHPQVAIGNYSLDMVMRSHLRLENIPDARRTLETMIELYPDESRTSRAGKVFYNELVRQLSETEDLIDRKAILLEMAQHLDRARKNGDKDYSTLWNLSLHWTELGELLDKAAMEEDTGPNPDAEAYFENAEVALRATHDAYFDADDKRSDDVKKSVDPKLGSVLLRLKKVEEAYAILSPLVMDADAKPARQTILDWTRALNGWVEGGGDQGPLVEVPAEPRTPEEYTKASKSLNSISLSRSFSAYTDCGWYEVKFAQTYTYYAWSKVDSSKKASISSQLNGINSQLSTSDWSDVNKWCSDPEGGEESVRSRLDGNVLRDRFRWLERQGK